MKKFVTFSLSLWKSVSSFSYYRDVVEVPLSFSIKYFLMFSLLLGTFFTVTVSYLGLPQVNNFLTRFKAKALNFYPPDVTITLKNGELSTSIQEPLRFPIPFELFTDTPPAVSDQKQLYLITIDPAARIEDYKTGQSLIFVTKNSVVVTDNMNEKRIYDLKEFGDLTVDKESVDRGIRKIIPYLNFVPVSVVVAVAIISILFLIPLRAVWILFMAVILLPVARLLGLKLAFGKLYQIGLHAQTLPLMIQIMMTSMGLFVPLPFFGSLLFLLYMLIILAELKKHPQSVPMSEANTGQGK